MIGGDTTAETITVLSVTKETKHQRCNRSEKGRNRYQRYRATTKGIINDLRQYNKKTLTRVAQLEEELECIRNQILKWRD